MHRSRRHRLAPPLAGLALLTGVLSPATAAQAQERDQDTQAREHFVVGRHYFEQARYPEAAREFEEAYRLSGRSALLLNLALAEERALDYDGAIAALRRYVEQEPDAANRDEIEGRIARLEELRRTHDARVRAEAEALAADRDGPDGDGGGGPTTLQWVGVGLLVGAGALGGAALGTGLAAESIYDDLDAIQDEDGRIPADRVEDRDRGESLAVASTALTFTAAALAIGGVVLVLVGGDDDEAPAPEAATRPRFQVAVGPNGGGATMTVRF